MRGGAAAVLIAVPTATAAAVLGGGGLHVGGGALYVAVVGAAALGATGALAPTLIAAQVVGGLALVATLLAGPGAAPPLALLPVVAGVVATAELLGAATRAIPGVARGPGGELRRAGGSALLGGGVFGAVSLAATLPGPRGLTAAVLAAGACVALALALAGRADEGGRGETPLERPPPARP